MKGEITIAIRILLCLQCKKSVSIMLKMIKGLSYNSPLFTLKIRQTRKVTAIDMQLGVSFVNTCDIPETLEFLEQNYPSVLKTQCFNEQNLPFAIEVNATEIGHLFEHILIDKLCSLKIKNGAKQASFNGTTSWNWQENPRGFFQIWIDIGRDDLELLIEGLRYTIDLTTRLMKPPFARLLLENIDSTKILRATAPSPAEN